MRKTVSFVELKMSAEHKVSRHAGEVIADGQATVFPRIIAGGDFFLFSHQKGAIIRGKAIIRGRRLFQIFLTGGRALNSLFYYTKQ